MILIISVIAIFFLLTIINSLQNQLKINDLILIECEKRINYLKQKQKLNFQYVTCVTDKIDGFSINKQYKILLELNEMYAIEDDNKNPQFIGINHFKASKL